TEHEWKAIGEAGPNFIDRTDAKIGSDMMFLCVGITFPTRLFSEISNAIRPFRFRTNALLSQRFDSVAEKGAAVLIHGAFDRALVVVNKEAAKVDKFGAVLDLKKLERANERVGRAAAELSLIFDRRTFRAQIDFARQFFDPRFDCGVSEIALVRQVRQPAVPFGRTRVDFRAHATHQISLRNGSESRAHDDVENAVNESIY